MNASSAEPGIHESEPSTTGDIAQTLDRGLEVLDVLLVNPQGLSINEIGERLGVARSISRRLVATLARRGLVFEVNRGRFQLGAKLVELGAGVQPQLQAVSEPILRESARVAGATAVLSIADGDQGMAVISIAPPDRTIHVAWRVGGRFPLDRGASGLAMLSLRPVSDGEPDEVKRCRDRGWAWSFGELEKSMSAVAAPIRTRWPITASVGLVVAGSIEGSRLGPMAAEAAGHIGLQLDQQLGI